VVDGHVGIVLEGHFDVSYGVHLDCGVTAAVDEEASRLV